MKYSKLMKERIRRVKVLFKELGYNVFDGERQEESFTAGFEDNTGFQSGFFIDTESKFLEIAFSFSFSPKLGHYIKERLEEMMKICFEYGCYMNMQLTDEDISFSLFSKIYFSGLNYFSLRDTISDFRLCVADIKELVDFQKDEE
jgi:hypothetical protein